MDYYTSIMKPAATSRPQWIVREGAGRYEIWTVGSKSPVAYFTDKDAADALVAGLLRAQR